MRNSPKLFLFSLVLILAMLSPVSGQNDDEVSSGILDVGNGFYKVFVDAATGMYTASTDVQHPAGSGLSVLYDGDSGQPATSFNTLRSYTSQTDYVQRESTSREGFASISLSLFTPRSQVIEGNAIRTRYVLNPTSADSQARDALEIIQDIRVIGTNQRDSAVQVTTRVTNMGSDPLRIGVRYLWDFEIGLDDGPGFSTQNPNSANINEEVEYFAPPFSYFQIQDNDLNNPSPILSVLGTVNSQGSFNPPATRPSLLRNACWIDASESAFEYTINPSRDINTVNSDCRGANGGDGAVMYYFGHDSETAYEIRDSDTVTISAYIFLNPPAPTDTLDSDGDGLLDSWETHGIDFDNDGTVDLKIDGLNPMRKDILVYYDWTEYKDGDNTVSNAPLDASLAKVVQAFADAPVTNLDGSQGITLHFRKGTAVSEGDDRLLGSWSGWFYSWQEFADIKAASFPAEYWPFYHYMIFATKHAPNGSSGRSRNGGDFSAGASDFFVTIGSWNLPESQKVLVESSTIMHELGHNLGLGHGGVHITTDAHNNKTVYASHANGKPNHLSIMSYSFQTQGIPTSDGAIIDYSRFNGVDLPMLNETALSESTWVGAMTTTDGTSTLTNPNLAGYSLRYYCPTSRNEFELKQIGVDKAVDWNCDEVFAETPISANIDGSENTRHTTENEWDNIIYSGGAIGGLGSALDLPLITDTRLAPEPTLQQYQALLNNVFIGFDTGLVVNGDFEVPEDVEVNGLIRIADNTFLHGWVLVDGDVEVVSAAIWQPASGQRSLDLSGSSAGTIQQNIPTEIGQTYELRFAFSGYPSPTPREKSMRVEISGQPESFPFSVDSSSFMPENMNWEYKTITFTAVDTITVITFRSEIETNTGPLIDDVSVSLVPGETQTGACIADILLANELSDAIMAANAGTGCANIRLNADIPLGELLPPFPGEFGDNAFPIVTSAITIDGNGFTISRVNATADFRFFEVNGRNGNQGNLTLKNMRLSGGNMPDSGAVLVDGSNGGSAFISIDNVAFSGNRSNGNGGALTLLSFGGGQTNAVIANSAFTDNHGVFGGAIYIGGFDNGNATTQITNTVFDLNTSADAGGAIYNNGQGDGGNARLTVEDSRFSGNQAGGAGGGIINMARRSGNAALIITGSSFLDNIGRLGNAISNDGSENGAAQLEVDGIAAAGTDLTCFNSDASGVVVRDETCGE